MFISIYIVNSNSDLRFDSILVLIRMSSYTSNIFRAMDGEVMLFLRNIWQVLVRTEEYDQNLTILRVTMLAHSFSMHLR
jgi:hypothetical protein